MRTTPYEVGEIILVIHPEFGPLAGVVAEIREDMVFGRFKGVDGLMPLDDELRDVNFQKLWEYHELLFMAITRLREGMELTMTDDDSSGNDERGPDNPFWKDLLMRMDAEAIEEDMNRLFDAEQNEWWDKQISRRRFGKSFWETDADVVDEGSDAEPD